MFDWAGWTGRHCNLETETECEDGVDNDGGKTIFRYNNRHNIG